MPKKKHIEKASQKKTTAGEKVKAIEHAKLRHNSEKKPIYVFQSNRFPDMFLVSDNENEPAHSTFITVVK